MAPSIGVSVSAFLRNLGINLQHKSRIEEPLYTYAKFGYPKSTNLSSLRTYVLSMPEIYGRMQSIINDIVNGYEVSCADKVLKSRAEQFLVDNDFILKLESALLDQMIYGDGYLEPVFVREAEAESLAREVFKAAKDRGLLKKNYPIDRRITSAVSVANVAGVFEPTEVWWVDSRYVYKEVDDKGRLLKYVQRIRDAQIVAEWGPDQLIDISYPKYNSDVYGFTPLSVALADLGTLDTTKKYIKNFFEKNGIPDYLIALKNASPDSDSFKALQEEMKNRRENYERGSLVITGDLAIQQLTQVRDMDFRVLSKHLGELIDLLWGIPVQKNAVDASSTRSIDTFMAPYYTHIRKQQRILEDLLNSRFFSLFGEDYGHVKIKFNNPYLRDAVRNVSWATTAWGDGILSLSEYRLALSLSDAIPIDLKENPNFGLPRTKTINPFKGVYSDNNTNKQDKNLENPKEIIEKLGLTEGINWA